MQSAYSGALSPEAMDAKLKCAVEARAFVANDALL